MISDNVMIKMKTEGLKYAAIRIKTRIEGIASSASAILMTITSYVPPTSAAETPTKVPIVHAMAATETPKSIDVLSDQSNSLNMS